MMARFFSKLQAGWKLQGCTQDDFQEIENRFGVVLPLSYRKYLLQYGRKPEPRFVGSDCCYPELLELKDAAAELLAECGQPFQLEEKDFVFLMRQGYQFLYFTTDGVSDDPPVYHFMEGWDGPKLVAQSFTEWLTLE
jgi:hypothetical protein